ncbi:MAG: alginate export family protein [Acidobacteria bacterium]|nr:alginate export family protein [Acidobacteriota bacterium]
MPPLYKSLRDEEDWSYLCDPARRTDYLDPVKYIPLREGREDWYLTIGGEVRFNYERYLNEEWGERVRDGNGYLLQRYMLHFDLHLGRRVRVFVQPKSGIATSRRGGPAPPDEDKLDINQAFVDLSFGFGDKNGKPPALVVRAGRQEISLGSGRLVSEREGPNVRVGFDGLRATVRAGAWRLDGFVTKPVETDRGFFDDEPLNAETFWGIYASRPLPLIPKSNLDIYFLSHDRKLARFDQGVGRETRHSLGARLWNRGQAFDYDLELVYQLGAFGQGSIRAWGGSSTTGYRFARAPLRPRIALDTGATSGDSDPRDPDLETLRPPFPRGKYFGPLAANGPSNFVGFRPSLTLQLHNRVSLVGDTFFFWRESRRDGVYGIPGNLLRTGRSSRARYIGTQPGAEIVWQADRHAAVSVAYAHYFTGRFLRETPPGRDISYFEAKVTYKF